MELLDLTFPFLNIELGSLFFQGNYIKETTTEQGGLVDFFTPHFHFK